MEYLYKEETDKIIGLHYEVYNTMGWGYRESHYEKAIMDEAHRQGIPCKQQILTPLYYKNKSIGYNRCDLKFYDKIIVELKVGDRLTKQDFDQLNEYLKEHDVKIGLLILFSAKGVVPRRLANVPNEDIQGTDNQNVTEERAAQENVTGERTTQENVTGERTTQENVTDVQIKGTDNTD